MRKSKIKHLYRRKKNNKRERTLIVLIVLFFVISITLIFVIHLKPAKLPLIQTKPLRFFHINNSVYLYLNILNLNKYPAICNASIEIVQLNNTSNLPLGFLNGNSTTSFLLKQDLPYGELTVRVKPECTFINSSFLDDFINEVINKTHFRSCYDAKDSSQTLFCLAFLSHNLSLCNFIPSDEKRKLCYAYLTSSSYFCGLTRNKLSSDMCFEDLAVNWKNETICDKINSDSFKASCESVLSNNLSECLSVKLISQRDNCVTFIAIEQQNLSVCKYSSNETECEHDAKASFE